MLTSTTSAWLTMTLETDNASLFFSFEVLAIRTLASKIVFNYVLCHGMSANINRVMNVINLGRLAMMIRFPVVFFLMRE
jgi:hypothetical protein